MGIADSRNPLHSSRTKNTYHVVLDIRNKQEKCFLIDSDRPIRPGGQHYTKRSSPVLSVPRPRIDHESNVRSPWFVDNPTDNNQKPVDDNHGPRTHSLSPTPIMWKSEPILTFTNNSPYDDSQTIEYTPKLFKSVSMKIYPESKQKCRIIIDSDCNYTCHEQCMEKEPVVATTQHPEKNNCEGSISTPASGDQSFHGLIRVHMNLTRPINIIAGTRPPSTYDIVNKDDTIDRTLTSFHLPRDTVKSLHVTNETTAQQVITGLLRKFKVIDDPTKFALYERDFEPDGTSKVKLKRLNSEDKPLCMVLNWTDSQKNFKSFVLQENDMTDISWECFTIPELQNFLRILDREQKEYESQIQEKYDSRKRRLKEAISKVATSEGSSVLPNK